MRPTERRVRPTGRSGGRRLAGAALTALLLAGGNLTAAYAETGSEQRTPGQSGTAEATSLPTLTPGDGAYLEGTQKAAGTPTLAGDSVTRLAVDGKAIDGERTVGVSRLGFDVGSNSTEARYHNYVLVNGEYRADIGDLVNERGTIEIPNQHLVKGENKIEFFAGTVDSSCGTNYDDFVLSDISLDLLGEVADGEENEYTYSFGDGSCGSNTSLLTKAVLSFFVLGDPQGTTGLTADLDTTKLANGVHTLTATTAAGRTVKNTVTVNNAPAGAPGLLPKDGTLVAGRQSVFTNFPAGAEGAAESLTVDGDAPVTDAHLGNRAATFSFDVGSDSIDDRYDNYLLVNGKRIDMGGTWVSQRVDIAIPARFLVPGDNTVTVVTSPYRESCGNNRDDFDISRLAFAFDGGTVTGRDIADSYAMGDGTCGNSDTRLREVELHYAIDAPAVHVSDTLGSGNATLGFTVGSNSIEARYQNHILVNGQKHVLDGDFVSRHVDLAFPNEWLVPGWNTIDFVAGTYPTSCGDNHDDFAVSGITLTPANGTAAGRMLKGSYSLGDGNCGDNVNPLTEIDLEFFVEGPAQGLRADLDTTKLDDGKHTLAATSKTGRTATRVLVTDNSAPRVAASVPAAGQKITASVVLDVRLEDLSGVVNGPDVKLDGKPVQLGAPVGPGLSAGEHTLTVSGTDGIGNSGTRKVKFTSAGIPDVPADLTPKSGTTDAGSSVKLSAKVAEPDGGEVSATFSEAEILTPNQVYQGTAASVPTTLEVKGEKKVKAEGLAPADGRTLEAPAAEDVTFQRFDVQVKGHVDAPVLRWEGVIDPERLAALRVWNTATSKWDVLTSARGVAEGDTVLTAVVDRKYVDGQQVHTMVTGEDPFADDIDAGDPNRFADPDSYDFSIVHYTDTQYLSEGAVEQETPEERAVWEKAYGDVSRWIADNKDKRKIAYVAHTGDIIENNIRKPADEAMQRQITGELELSSKQQKILDDAGVPNGVIAGNHDNQSGTENGPDAIYNQYYGPERYQALSKGWKHAEYGGPWREGDNQNHYDLFSAGGLDFVVVGLSYGVTREEAEWADSVFKRFPDRNGILLSHDYLAPSGSPNGRGAPFSAPDGSMLYKKVVQDNPNVFLILAGHEHGVGTNVKPKVGEVAHDVVELLADYQFYTVSADRLGLTEIGGYKPDDKLQFGASFFRMLQFDVDRSELTVDTYSPLLDEFGATEYDTNHRYDGTEDNMVLPIDLSSRKTTFKTDSLALYDPVSVIGKTKVDSGGIASVTWKGLKPGTTHAWFVTARSTGGGVTASEPSAFVTKDAHGRPGVWGADTPAYPWFTSSTDRR
ncbi:metallophosphoesterase [Streptomyces sp. NBC_00841]|uniref:metallophosphoesterase n=1 Tax=Streptomyces sp. NBC_00841 TaxID=2975847 RepID=UPI002DDC4C4F|nr:metallophosphoesterase [Streptomyces sp. NBC_00841]WSA02438.1 metallophosphoesterase [Streptomyces sp. NBC_00841]